MKDIKMINKELYVYITLEEYKNLIEIKGRYSELKEIYDKEKSVQTWNPTKIFWNGTEITCKEPDNYTYTGCSRCSNE